MQTQIRTEVRKKKPPVFLSTPVLAGTVLLAVAAVSVQARASELPSSTNPRPAPRASYVLLEKSQATYLPSNPTFGPPSEGDGEVVEVRQCQLLSDGTVRLGRGVAKGHGAIIGEPVEPWKSIERESGLIAEQLQGIRLMAAESREYGKREVPSMFRTSRIEKRYNARVPLQGQSFSVVDILVPVNDRTDELSVSPHAGYLLGLLDALCVM